MKWTAEAEEAIKKVPFFVRKKVRAKVEQEVLQDGRDRITLAEVKATRNFQPAGIFCTPEDAIRHVDSPPFVSYNVVVQTHYLT
jgi:hypothetical protein